MRVLHSLLVTKNLEDRYFIDRATRNLGLFLVDHKLDQNLVITDQAAKKSGWAESKQMTDYNLRASPSR